MYTYFHIYRYINRQRTRLDRLWKYILECFRYRLKSIVGVLVEFFFLLVRGGWGGLHFFQLKFNYPITNRSDIKFIKILDKCIIFFFWGGGAKPPIYDHFLYNIPSWTRVSLKCFRCHKPFCLVLKYPKRKQHYHTVDLVVTCKNY